MAKEVTEYIYAWGKAENQEEVPLNLAEIEAGFEERWREYRVDLKRLKTEDGQSQVFETFMLELKSRTMDDKHELIDFLSVATLLGYSAPLGPVCWPANRSLLGPTEWEVYICLTRLEVDPK